MQATSDSRGRQIQAPPAALDRAEKAARRARRNAQVRIRFISRDSADDPAPPLARLLRGGRGGQVRLKLLLSYLWMQTDERGVPLAYPAQVWAQLLGLDRPEDAGARRINEAQAWLERNKFITVQAKPGYANRVTVLTETGDKNPEPYLAPGAAARARRNTPDAIRHLYVQIPATFWTNGYLALLSGAGLALYLILLDQYGPGQLDDAPGPVWFSPKAFKDRYALSEDTRAKGINDLQDLGLVAVTRQPINPGDFDLERIRNAYTLLPAFLNTPATRSPASPPADGPVVIPEGLHASSAGLSVTVAGGQ